MRRKRRPDIGDLYEFPTPRGAVYLQYVYEDAQMGSLIRVLAGFFDHRPESLDKISTEEERFLTFFPVRAAESEKIIEFVGNEPVPERCQKLPTFRSPGKIDTINKLSSIGGCGMAKLRGVWRR